MRRPPLKGIASRALSSYPVGMRIIAGEFRSRRLFSPPDAEITRPIPDRVKESLFSLLRGHFEDATVFDGFAGTGSIGLEAVSRGAARCVLVEKDKSVAAILRKNVEALGCEDRAEVVVGDCLGAGALGRAPRPLKLAFLDPPYPLVREPLGFKRVMNQMAALVNILSDDGFGVLRLPYPMEIETPLEVAEDPLPVKRRPKDFRRAAREQPAGAASEAEGEDGGDDGDGRAVEQSQARAAEAEIPLVTRTLVTDLSVVGANGPETHLFQTMGIHLYMRTRAGG